jgi:hypothetical protein
MVNLLSILKIACAFGVAIEELGEGDLVGNRFCFKGQSSHTTPLVKLSDVLLPYLRTSQPIASNFRVDNLEAIAPSWKI